MKKIYNIALSVSLVVSIVFGAIAPGALGLIGIITGSASAIGLLELNGKQVSHR